MTGSARLSVFLMAVCLLGGTTGPLWGQVRQQVMNCSGTVYDWQGRPVAGAEVLCAEKVYDFAGGRVTWGTPARTTTDRNGHFSAQVTVERKLEIYALAWKEGVGLGWQSPVWPGIDDVKAIRLYRPAIMAGVVVDVAGKPIAGAVVRPVLKNQWVRSSSADCFDEPRQWLTARTDEQGRFRFDHVPDCASADFQVAAAGFACGATYQEISPTLGTRFMAGQTDIRVILKPEAVIRGKIVNEETGQGVAGVTLLARPNRRDANYHCVAPVTSGTDGSFVYRGLAADDYSLQIVAPRDRAAEWTGRDVKVTAVAGQTVDVNVPVGKGAWIEVTVQDIETGRPIQNARVGVRERASFSEYPCWYCWVYTNAEGLARLRAPTGEWQLVEASADDYQYATDERPRAVSKDERWLTLSKNEVVRRVVKLHAYPVITGTVHDPDGRPAVSVTVVGRRDGVEAVRTDEQGRFRVVIGKQGGIKGAVVLARDIDRNLAAFIEVKEEGKPVELTLAPALVARGRVIDPNAKGVAGAFVTLNASQPVRQVTPTVCTNPNGDYEIRTIPPLCDDYAYWTAVHAQGYGPVSVYQSSFTAPQNNEVRLDPIILTPADKSVSGVVVDANGVPVPRIAVLVTGPNGSEEAGQPDHRTIADDKGRFSVDGVMASLLRVEATVWRGLDGAGSAQVEGGDQNVKVVIGRHEMRDEILPLLGKPLPDLKAVLGSGDPNQVQGKPLLICFIDMQQRPSRNAVAQLAKQIGPLQQKGVAVAIVQAAEVDETTVKSWAKEANVTLPVVTIQADADKVRKTWGVQALPWLILTDKNHIVRAEGFRIEELEGMLEKN